MRKLLLLLVAACFVMGVNAQKATDKATDAVKMNQKKSLFDSEYQGKVAPPTLNHVGDEKYGIDSMGLVKVEVGTAFSQRSFRREDCKVISYNKDLDLISMTFILDPDTYPSVALSDGSVATFYSEDHGQTWSNPVLLSDLSSEDLQNYYQSGIIYNPSGNDVIENAYGVYQGVAPTLPPSTGVWNNQAFGSSTLGGANYFTEYFTNSEPDHEHDGYFNQFGLTQKEDMVKCFNIWAEGGWSAFTALKMEDIQGTYNGTGFDWELEHSVIDMPFNIDPADGEAMWVGKFTFSDVGADMAWSDDGMIGYAWMVGSNENMETGYWPILFKTTDGGNNWDELELDIFDNDVQDVFRNDATDPTDWLLLPCQDANEQYLDFAIPWFNATVGAVDSDGNLQLFGDCGSHSRDIFDEWEYYEGIGWKYNSAGCIFKFEIGDEIIDVMFVDSLMSNPATDLVDGTTNDSLYCGTNGWLRRMQLSKDERSEEFFLTWTDTPSGQRVAENLLPDLKGWSFNSFSSEATEPVCFTCGTLFLEYYWYVQASEYAYYNATDSTFYVPMVNAVNLDDFYSNSSGSADPVHVQYVDGVSFKAISPLNVGVEEFSAPSNFSVSQNLPNPATGVTTIEISSETVAPVTVEISNIVGQTVHTTNAGIIHGNMSVNIDVSNFEAGVYLYTVTIANERVSKRMIVK